MFREWNMSEEWSVEDEWSFENGECEEQLVRVKNYNNFK